MLVASSAAPAGALCVVQLLLRLHRLLSTSQYLRSRSVAIGVNAARVSTPQYLTCKGHTIRCEMLFNVRSKTDISQLNLPHGTDN